MTKCPVCHLDMSVNIFSCENERCPYWRVYFMDPDAPEKLHALLKEFLDE